MRDSWQKIVKITLLSIIGLVFSACRLPSTATPTAYIPIVPLSSPTYTALPTITPPVTEMVVLPYVAQSQLDSSPTSAVLSTASPMPIATLTPTPVPQITLLFSGIIVPARCVQAAIDARGDANYIYDEVRETISAADLAVGTLNATLSDLSIHTGCIETYVLVSDSRSAVAAASAGFDVMGVATNHIKNCAGPSCADEYNRAFLDTLDNLRANNIQPVGAGLNVTDALQPVIVNVKGVRFGFISLGMVEPNAFASKDRPGIGELTDDNLRAAISAARLDSDVVIAMPHWGPEDVSDPNSYQLHFAQVAVEAGADVVVGNHTHVVQAIQQINGIDVFYGLGNFVFDQTWDLAHQQGVMLLVHFSGRQYTGYELIPTHVDGDGTVHIAEQEEAAGILQRIKEASDRLKSH